MALWQDDGLLQAAHDDPPQLLQHTLQHGLLTHGGEQRQPVKQTNTENRHITTAMNYAHTPAHRSNWEATRPYWALKRDRSK